MIHLELSPDETRLLAEVLESELHDLSYEISSTDSQDYRNGLKRKKAVVARVLEDVGRTMTLPAD